MGASFFKAATLPRSNALEVTIEWHQHPTKNLQSRIIQLHVESFDHLYLSFSEQELGLKDGLTKKAWLQAMVVEDLEKVLAGELHLATISLNGALAGYAICTKTQIKEDHSEVYLNLLAVKPFKNLKTGEPLRVGLGRQLIDSVINRHEDATAITLDTRRINKPAIAFYEQLGFECKNRNFSEVSPVYYVGVEKRVPRPGYLAF